LVQRASSGRDDFCDVSCHEEQHGQENKSSTQADRYAVNHDLRPFDDSVGDLFDHMSSGVESCQSKRALQQAQHPSDPIRPPRLVQELPIYELAGIVVGRGARQDGDTDDHKTADGPSYSGFVDGW
jgi:hypothetical protein